MVKEPQVFLMDEPLSNLDARLRLETREEIRRIQQETGITTIFNASAFGTLAFSSGNMIFWRTVICGYKA